MFVQPVRRQFIICVLVIMLIVVSIFGDFVSAQANPNTTISTVFIDSRFKLWDETEKLLDENFNITIFYLNSSSNNTGYYKIDIDSQISEGIFTNYIKKEYLINETFIHYLRIYVNNQTILEAYNIIITNQISKSLIDYANSQWTINLSPFEWTKKEQNVFFAGVIGAILCLVISYRITTKYKKSKGIKTYK